MVGRELDGNKWGRRDEIICRLGDLFSALSSVPRTRMTSRPDRCASQIFVAGAACLFEADHGRSK